MIYYYYYLRVGLIKRITKYTVNLTLLAPHVGRANSKINHIERFINHNSKLQIIAIYTYESY